MIDILSLLPAFFSAVLASVLTHAFTSHRFKNEFKLKKLEELLTKAQTLRQVETEVYELHLYHSLNRAGIKDYFDMRAKVNEINLRYGMPHHEMRALAEIYFPEVYDPVNNWINSLW